MGRRLAPCFPAVDKLPVLLLDPYVLAGKAGASARSRGRTLVETVSALYAGGSVKSSTARAGFVPRSRLPTQPRVTHRNHQPCLERSRSIAEPQIGHASVVRT